MKRLEEAFARGRVLVAYLCVGDPSVDESIELARACVHAGADVLELGVPFSDPLADGPTIQRASERALKSGTTLAGVIALVRRIRQSSAPLQGWFRKAAAT